MPGLRFFAFVLFAVLCCACEACKDAPTGGGGTTPPKWVSYTTANSQLVNNYITAIVLDGDGRMWLGTKGGASCYSRGLWESYTKELSWVIDSAGTPKSISEVTSIARTAKRSIWFGLAGGGIVQYNMNASTIVWKRYMTNDGLPYNYVNSVAANWSTEDIWCATTMGVARFRPTGDGGGVWKIFSDTTRPCTLPADEVTSVAYNSTDHSVWFGTLYSGLVYINGDGYWQPQIPFPAGESSAVTGFGFDMYNTVWCTKWIGVSSYNSQTIDWHHYTSETTHGQLPVSIVNAVTTDFATTRWFGTNAGLVRFKDTTWTMFNHKNTPQLPSDMITALAYDIYGKLWIGTMNGVAVYDENGK